MSEEQNKEVVHRYYEAYNTGSPGAFESMFAADYVLHNCGRTTRPESAAQMHAQIAAGARATFPDLRYEIEDLLADGDKLVDRTSVSGTLKGEFRTRWGTFPPTNQTLTWTEISIHRFAGGEIAEQWWELDWAGILTQLGAIAAPRGSTT